MSKDNKFEDNLLFLLKFRKYLPTNSLFQYFFLFTKYIPLLMISHDIHIHQASYFNDLIAFLTMKRIFDIRGSGSITIIVFFLLLGSLIYFYTYLKEYHNKIKRKNDPLANAKPSKYFTSIFMVFSIIFIFLNQNIYEVLFSFYLCEGTIDPKNNSVSLTTDCYSPFRIIIIILSGFMTFILLTVSYLFNLIYFQPWFSSDCIIPSIFNGNNSIWTALPLVQGYITLEANLPDNYALTIRYITRAVFILYSIQYYYRIDQFVITNKKVFLIINFLNTFCFISILLEFIPPLTEQLTSVSFVILKVLFQITFALLVLVYFIRRQKRTLLEFAGWKNSLNFYELYSRFLFLLLNFDNPKNEDELETLINQYFEMEITKSNSEEHVEHQKTDKNTHHPDLNDVYNKTKSFFKILKGLKSCDEFNSKDGKALAKQQEIIKFNKNKLIFSKLNYYVEEIDKLFLSVISDEKGSEISRFKYIIIYSLFCNFIKMNYVSAFFFLEKLSFTKVYNNSFNLRLYYANIKKLICKDHYKIRVTENEEKRGMKQFFDCIKDFDNLTSNLTNSVDCLKDLTNKVNSDGVNLMDFTKIMEKIKSLLATIHTKTNKTLVRVLSNLIETAENYSLISKYKIFNDLVFKDSEDPVDRDLFHEEKRSTKDANDKYAIAYLDEYEDIYLLKCEKKTQALLGYEGVDLKGTNVLAIIPSTIGKYHKKITTAFTSSNKDFRKIDLFFITKEKYNIPFSGTLIIFPMFDDRILFFVMCELFNKDTAQLYTGNPLQLPTNNFKCFAELNNQAELVTINKEFERVFGINRDVIDSPSGKFNFLSRVLRLQTDKVFNKFDHVQHYQAHISFTTIFENIKKLNYEEFREYSLEAYYKFKSFLTNFNVRRYSSVMMNIFIERRIIDKQDGDFFYYVVLTVDRKKQPHVNNKNEERKTNSIIQSAIGDEYTSKKEKKISMLAGEISNMSRKMLNEGSRLWDSNVKYSEITEYTDSDKVANAFDLERRETKADQIKKNELNKSNTNKGIPEMEEFNIFKSGANSGIFRIKNFMVFVLLSVFLIVFYVVVFTYINNEYSMSLNISKLNINILLMKYSQIMTVFLIVEKYLVNNNLFPPTDLPVFSTTSEIQIYIDELNQNVYEFQQILSLISSDSNYNSTSLNNIINKVENYKTIVQDFSIYMRNFTFYDSVDIFRLKVERYDYFDNLTFTSYPSEFSQNGISFDINKKLNQSLTYASH